MKFYTVSHPSANQSFTPEGSCSRITSRFGRTGSMIYVAGEVPVDAGRDGIIESNGTRRTSSPSTRSRASRPNPSLDHPTEDVGAGNRGSLAKGIVQHARHCEGIEDDILLADLLITDKDAIESVRSGLREVSCGLGCHYSQSRNDLEMAKIASEDGKSEMQSSGRYHQIFKRNSEAFCCLLPLN